MFMPPPQVEHVVVVVTTVVVWHVGRGAHGSQRFTHGLQVLTQRGGGGGGAQTLPHGGGGHALPQLP